MRPSTGRQVVETTALGAAYLAGLQAGFYPEPAKFADLWSLDKRFTPEHVGCRALAPARLLARRRRADAD